MFKIVRDKTLTLNLSEREMKILEDMCKKKEMTKSGLIRHALAVYQSVEWPVPRLNMFKEDE